MSETTINTRIKQRYDTLDNWLDTSVSDKGANLILRRGEVAIVDCGDGIVKIKVGDGISTFSQLKYLGEVEFESNHISAHSISQGVRAYARPQGLAAGAFLSSLGDYSQAMGINAKTVLSDQYAFVWSGDYTKSLGQFGGSYYESHGPGTFSVNPINGLSGIYIGENTLAEEISSNSTKVLFKRWSEIK